ncbi:MAG: TonB-dependent receptor domain-containing protein [Bacillota bacterium]
MRRFTPFILSTVSLAALGATPAFAQNQPITTATPPDQPSAPACAKPTGSPNDNCTSGEVETESGVPATRENSNAIVVTGTRIQRPNLESPVPITSISQEELTNQGQVSVGDALNDLPALRSTFSQQNSGRFIGTAGQNFLDLRGLGTNRTLVLVNGRRMITSAVGDFSVDVDNIPQDLIDRVDVVTGGESAVYGSDAVAGVVNFILKKNFDGFRIRGQGGISKYGDRPVDFISTTFGKNFAEDRGNVAVNLEYTHAGELFFRDRAHFRNVCAFEPNPADDGGFNDPTTASGDSTNGVPDNIHVCHDVFPFISNGGNVAVFGNGQVLAFAPNGDLVFSRVPDQNFVLLGGGIQTTDPLGGSTLRETGDLAVGRDRFSASLLGHFDVSDAFKPFVEGLFVKQKVHQEFQPTFFQGHLANFLGGPDVTCANPFLNDQARDVLTNTRSTCALRNPDGTIALDANGNRIFNPNGILSINRFNVDFGARKEIDDRTTYRIVGGVTGDFNDDWHYEVSVNYGHHKADNAQHNDLLLFDENGNPAGFNLAIDAVSVDANGNILLPGQPGFGEHIVCRSTITDPGNGCVPINIFGEGAPSPEALDFVNRTSHLYQKASELDLLAFMSGDTSQWFSLQGGPIGFSIGAEHRRETAELHADPISAAGGTFFNAFSPFNPPTFKVTEFFGELNVPILKDLPFANELTVSGAARRSHYALTGNTFAWNANAIWSPVRDLRLRANYSKSVRVPTLNDLFTNPTVDFAFITDPCDQFNINQNPNRAANCAALGVPTTVLPGSPCEGPDSPVGSPFHNCITNTQNTLVEDVGNKNLTAETGRSITVGGVFTPRFVPGFSLSVDYFDITVSKMIQQLSANAVANLCVDQPTINNQFCALLFPRDEFGLFGSPAAIQQPFNFAKQKSRGIDFDLSYRHRFGNGNRLNLRGFATYTLERTNFPDILNPKFQDRILSELGDPVFSGTAIASYGIGKFDLRYTLRYIGSMTDFSYEDTHKFPGACTTQNGAKLCPPFNSDIADHPDTGAVWYHDVRVDYTINKFQFYVGVDNVFNKMPPLGLTGAGAGSGIYSNFGRFFYAGAVVDLK